MHEPPVKRLSLQEMRRPSVPLHVEVTALLRNRILSGELPSGAQLPPINQLSEQMGLAKMTVRQAMDSLEAEGLIERQSGRGTFVRDVALREPKFLKMHADLSQLHQMVSDLDVAVAPRRPHPDDTDASEDGIQAMRRIHLLNGKPFCMVDLKLSREIYERAPQRFETEVVVTVLKDLGIDVATAQQRVTISYADVEAAQTLGVHLNSPVMHVSRHFLDSEGQRIYSAKLIYPGDALGFEIDFRVSE